MSGVTDMNKILGQCSTNTEAHKVTKQNLELNQQFVAQKKDDQKNKSKSKVQQFGTENRIEINNDQAKDNKKGQKHYPTGENIEKKEERFDSSEGNLIDIKA